MSTAGEAESVLREDPPFKVKILKISAPFAPTRLTFAFPNLR